MSLTKEIVKHIFECLGFVPPPNFNKVGISLNNFKTNKQITIPLEDGDVLSSNLWCGQVTDPSKSVMRALATIIDDNGNYDLLLAFTINNKEIFGLRFIWGTDEVLFLTKSKEWKNLSTYQKLIISAGIEKLTTLGFSWNPCKDFEDLHEAILQLLDMGQ